MPEAHLIQSNHGKPGDTAKIEYYYDANWNGIDDDGSVPTSIAVVKIEYRWMPPAELATGQYLIRVNTTAASGASGNYDLNFHATSGNLTSEDPTIPIPIGNPTVAAATSGSPIPGFEAAFAVVGLVIIAYVVSRRR